jgi:hypothetical protein
LSEEELIERIDGRAVARLGITLQS